MLDTRRQTYQGMPTYHMQAQTQPLVQYVIPTISGSTTQQYWGPLCIYPLSHLCLIFEAVLTQCYVNATTFRLISHSGLARHRLASFIAVLSIVALDLLNTVATLAKSSILFLW